MDIYTEVVNAATIPAQQDDEGMFKYHSDQLVAAAVTQTFHYMVEAGLEYSYLTTGEGIVFLYLDWRSHPVTLHYHLAESAAEVQAHPLTAAYCTATSQVLAFTLLALSTAREHDQQDRDRLAKSLHTWNVDWAQILHNIPLTFRTPPPGSASYCPTTYSDVDRTPLRRNARRKKKILATEVDDYRHSGQGDRRTPDLSGDEEMDGGGGPAAREPDTPSPTESRKRRRGAGSSATDAARYCTQACLLGLVQGGMLDDRCPNVALHQPSPDRTRHHPISHTTFLRLLREQLQETLDDGVTRLPWGGARGVLFRVTLLAYGYTFVSKGTVSAFVPDLEHEAAVYRRLRSLQGVCVPVFLGAIDLRDLGRTYYYALKVRIIYMMLLAWGGEPVAVCCDDDQLPIAALPRAAGTAGTAGAVEAWKEALNRSVRALHAMGVTHSDLRRANLLWSAETRRIMIIDFERAVLASLRPAQARRHPLGRVVPPNSERRRRSGPSEGRKAGAAGGARAGGEAEVRQAQFLTPSQLPSALVAKDMAMAGGIF
jgi:hypothetical protein